MTLARTRPLLLALVLALGTGCRRGPSRDEALAAIRAAMPALDSATVTQRVWQDGPPWFSCAEVSAKLTKRLDTAAVRDVVGNWKPLVATGWIVLRDSAKGPVADPGWCTARVTAAGQPNVARWTPAPGDSFPTGTRRRGWMVVVGRQRLVVRSAPRMGDDDLATAEYGVTVATNDDGVAVGAGRDTAWHVATLRRDGSAWRLASTRTRASTR